MTTKQSLPFRRTELLSGTFPRWDGSDFLFLDGNPNIIIVSQRVAEVFSANDFTNVVAEPIA